MSKPYKVYKDFLDESYFKELKNLFINQNFQWFYKPRSGDGETHFDFDFMFVHSFYHFKNGVNSNFFEPLLPLVMKTGIAAGKTNIMRVKANLYTNQSDNITHHKHTDYPDELDYKTAVFNFTTCDGGTIFYIDGKEEFVESIENSVVIFDGPTDHAGVTQKNSNIRTLLNMDFNDGEYLGRY